VFTIMDVDSAPPAADADAKADDTSTDSEDVPQPEPETDESAKALDSLPDRREGSSWLVGLVVGLLIAVLSAQLAIYYRKPLIEAAPQLKPYFELLCENVGCTMALPRDPKQISIEASDLNRLPDREGVFLLTVTLTNRNKQAQDFPHLELTLTDARDQPVVRKVLTPEQWLNKAPDEGGFPGGATQTVEVEFSANDVNAAGYRLYAFYP